MTLCTCKCTCGCLNCMITCVCHHSDPLQVCILTPDGSHGVRRLPNAAEAGLCSACLDVHSNSILAGERALSAVCAHAPV